MSREGRLSKPPPLEDVYFDGNRTFTINDSGSFNKDDFSIKPEGVLRSPMMAQGAISNLTLQDLVIGECIGRGSSGSVHVATDKNSGENIAVKIINLHAAENRHQLVKELKALMACACPQVVGFYDAFFSDLKVYIAMEYMQFGSLETVMEKRGCIPEIFLAEVTRQVLAGIHFLHKDRHHVHRDLKPANILINKDGIVKISDFGISKQMESSTDMCKSFLGTANYMSPERMEAKEYSFSSDIWSLGIIILEMSIGRFPYPPSASYFDLLNKIMKEQPEPPPEDASDEFRDFVLSCLHRNPADRPTVTQLMDHPFVQRDLMRTEEIRHQFVEWLSS
mmetsp:Transcript_36764/g.95194  ORF Transcript_36764/g.95194 Transcript_36764/m.95194 type:complete len:336 (-) Transcript_36764:377-1384(-)